ncbi:hypothetical protein [Phycicoccus avicenniae]|uniref:hypothetical protein n=1 Tax=Phycicoccus avicenniae TaxID=2828860 RepID=UPI003D28A9E3
MATIRLGRTPDDLTVELVPGDPFTTVMRQFDKPEGDPTRQPEDWTSPPVLEFAAADVAPWTAVVAGNVATWAVPSTDVDALLATDEHVVELTVGGLVWARGFWTEA